MESPGAFRMEFELAPRLWDDIELDEVIDS